MKKHILALLFFTTFSSVFSQHNDVNEKPSATMWKGKLGQVVDSTSLLHAFKTGTTHGHFRYFFSSTTNEGNLSDYYANAAGGGIRFETNTFHNFQFAVSGFYFFNIGSSDLSKPDPITGQMNRYEIGLFDIEDPNNYKDMDRLEELYLKYNFKKAHLIFGRQLINTPLINLQDGRMRPTGVEGIWGDYSPTDKWRFEGGWLYAISPRSTTKWYGVGESIGIYPVGVNSSGKKSGYADNLDSQGVGALSLKFTPNKNWDVEAWDYFIENISNTVFVQTKYVKPFGANRKMIAAGQMIRQNAVNYGGNVDQALTYMEKGSKSLTFGGRLGMKANQFEYSLNYNRITKEGQFLFPREWGREPLYTYLPRERNEGAADVHAMTFNVDYQNRNSKLKTSVGVGYVNMPEVLDFEHNKYGLPSYYQSNVDVRYNFDKFFKGLDAQLLVVNKFRAGDIYDNPKYVINKVNMMLVNLVLNYHF
ncbi:MAG: OprD family outer membrane porin [Flavobacterium sp.]